MDIEKAIRLAAVKTNSTDFLTVMAELAGAGIVCKKEFALKVLYQVQQEKFGGIVSYISVLPLESRKRILGWRGCTA